MNEKRNPVLLGQVEQIDLVRPEVRAMLDNPGLYVGGDSLLPDMIVPIVSQNGRVYSMTVDTELDPTRFVSTLTMHGPYLAKAPESAADARVRALGFSGFEDALAHLEAAAGKPVASAQEQAHG